MCERARSRGHGLTAPTRSGASKPERQSNKLTVTLQHFFDDFFHQFTIDDSVARREQENPTGRRTGRRAGRDKLMYVIVEVDVTRRHSPGCAFGDQASAVRLESISSLPIATAVLRSA